MRQMPIRLDVLTFRKVRADAYQIGCSMASVIQEAIRKVFKPKTTSKLWRQHKFTFIAAGRSGHGYIAEQHDLF